MDTSAMMQQTSSLTSVQVLQNLSSLQKDMLGLQEAATASGFIGKQVTATDASGASVTGVVDKVTYTGSGPLLSVGGTDVPVGDVAEASNPPGSPPAA
jgi:flagellar basal-body rod modification protein FlgD